jgi:hypothetical protein
MSAMTLFLDSERTWEAREISEYRADCNVTHGNEVEKRVDNLSPPLG